MVGEGRKRVGGRRSKEKIKGENLIFFFKKLSKMTER